MAVKYHFWLGAVLGWCVWGVLLVGCQPVQPKVVLLQHVWARAVTPERAMTAFYLDIQNGTDAAVTVTGASSPACGAMELHQTEQQADGTMGMSPVESIVVPPGSTQALKPGGYHLMCMMADPELVAGRSSSLTVSFADGTSQTVDVVVREN